MNDRNFEKELELRSHDSIRRMLADRLLDEAQARVARDYLARQESLRASMSSGEAMAAACDANELARSANELALEASRAAETASSLAREAASEASRSAAAAARAASVNDRSIDSARLANRIAMASAVAAAIALAISIIALIHTLGTTATHAGRTPAETKGSQAPLSP